MNIRTTGLAALAMIASSCLFAQEAVQTVEVTNLGGRKGTVYVAWYNNADDFPVAGKAVYSGLEKISDKETALVHFGKVAPGTYAVAVFFDENDNGKLDTNFLGIPKEKYGFSNNIRPLMRAAYFSESAFSVTAKDAVISIKIK